MMSLNGTIFRVTGHLCGEFAGPRWIPLTRSFDVFFDLRLNKRLSKQSWGWWFETLSHPLWYHRHVFGLYHDDKIQCNMRHERMPGVLLFLFLGVDTVQQIHRIYLVLGINKLWICHIYAYTRHDVYAMPNPAYCHPRKCSVDIWMFSMISNPSLVADDIKYYQ